LLLPLRAAKGEVGRGVACHGALLLHRRGCGGSSRQRGRCISLSHERSSQKPSCSPPPSRGRGWGRGGMALKTVICARIDRRSPLPRPAAPDRCSAPATKTSTDANRPRPISLWRHVTSEWRLPHSVMTGVTRRWRPATGRWRARQPHHPDLPHWLAALFAVMVRVKINNTHRKNWRANQNQARAARKQQRRANLFYFVNNALAGKNIICCHRLWFWTFPSINQHAFSPGRTAALRQQAWRGSDFFFPRQPTRRSQPHDRSWPCADHTTKAATALAEPAAGGSVRGPAGLLRRRQRWNHTPRGRRRNQSAGGWGWRSAG